jgi:ketosteroid isomerase-like protein
MKKLMLIILLFVMALSIYAQTSQVEIKIRNLEAKEVQALLQQDTATLKTLWAHDYMVNAPFNRIVLGHQLDSVKADTRHYALFKREVEQVLVKGNIAISMGNETIEFIGNNPDAGKVTKRRYTNIWLKINGAWKLNARHANKICQ